MNLRVLLSLAQAALDAYMRTGDTQRLRDFVFYSTKATQEVEHV